MRKTQNQQLRIIGGEWRSRRLNFPAIEGLRPTLDRIRETLFNWLQYDVEGRRVLDVFAGSGALGFEALSRGAKQVQFLEKNIQAASQIQSNLTLLLATNAQVWAGDSLQWLARNSAEYDLVFLDPPFHLGLLQPAMTALKLEVGALVYVEHEPELRPQWPKNWLERKSKSSKELCYRLFEVV